MYRRIGTLAAASAAVLALGACTIGPASGKGGDEADFPTDSITVVVPYPAGSGPDAGARMIAQGMEAELGVSVVVENIEGGASTIGLYDLANRDADGYSIGLGSFSGISLQSRRIDNPFEGLASLTPIAQTKVPNFFVFASPDAGWASIDEFVAEAKARPGELTIGVPNEGSTPDLLVGLLEEAAGIELEHVYFDAGQQVLPVVNGTTDLGIAQAGPVVQYVETGELDFIGLMGSQAVEGLDVALFDDAGYDTSALADFEGFFGPAGLPDDVVGILSEAIRVAVESEEYQEFMATTYSSPVYLAPADFLERAQAQDEYAASLF